MAFMGILMFLMAFWFLFIASMVSVGVGLLIIGITGLFMDGIQRKQTRGKNSILKKIYNITAIVAGVAFILVPLVFFIVALFVSTPSGS